MKESIYDIESIENILQLFLNDSRIQALFHNPSHVSPTPLKMIKRMELVQTLVLV